MATAKTTKNTAKMKTTAKKLKKLTAAQLKKIKGGAVSGRADVPTGFSRVSPIYGGRVPIDHTSSGSNSGSGSGAQRGKSGK